jgi:hypothetical protein
MAEGDWRNTPVFPNGAERIIVKPAERGFIQLLMWDTNVQQFNVFRLVRM